MQTMEKDRLILSSNYEDNMIEAFVNKPTEPETILWYQNAFKKFNVNGIDTFAWHWSWWAFFGGFLFLLYRKAYLPALGLFLLQMVLAAIPIPFVSIISLILWVLTGGYSTYFVYKSYSDIKKKIEAVASTEDERIHLMRQLGGYNNWVIWLYGFFFLLTMLSIVTAVLLTMPTS